MIELRDEQPKAGSGAFEDTVSVDVCDAERGVFGLVRISRTNGGADASVQAVACFAGQTLATVAETAPGARIESWERAEAAGAWIETAEPLRRWRAGLRAGDVELELEARAISPAMSFAGPATAALSRLAGVRGYEHPCRVSGSLRSGATRTEVAGVGRHSHVWGKQAESVELRSLYAVSADEAYAIAGARITGRPHAETVLAALLAQRDAEPKLFEEARLSTVYDAASRPLKAGLELHMPDAEYPRRLAGEAVCEASAGSGGALRIAFLRWTVEGEPAQGAYCVVAPR